MRVLLLFAIFVLPVILSSQTLYDDLIYFYPFNESGNTLVFDATENSFTGVLSGVENTTDRFGNENCAKQFNGQSSYISIPYQAMALTEFPISIAFWVKLDSVGHTGGVIRTEWQENVYTGSWINIGSSTINMAYGDCGPSGQQSRRSKFTNHFFLDEQWHHVVAVFSDEINTNTELNNSGNYAFNMEMYIDGFLTSGNYSGTGNPLCYDSNDNPQWPEEYGGIMGKCDANTDASSDTIYHFKGKLDNVGYWSRALSSDEVLDLYLNGLFDECDDLFDECGSCGGQGPQIICWDQSLVCEIWDCPEEPGCMYNAACNYNANAIIEDGSCVFPGEECEMNDGGTGIYNNSCECVENVSFLEAPLMNKRLLKRIHVLGNEANKNNFFFLEIYDDGLIEKKYLLK